MHSLPLLHRLTGQPVIVLGEGEAAAAKIRLLERAGARIVGVDDAQARLAFVALDDPDAAVARLKARGLLVNAVDRPDLCDFTVPSLLERGPVLQGLWGVLSYLRQRGAVSHPELARFAEDGNIFGFAMSRNEWLPAMGERTPRPTYLTLGTHQHFDKLINARQQTWYERWMAACLGQQMLISAGMAILLAGIALRRLFGRGG